jgi:cation diffusion facilitator family transporter
MSSSVKSYSSRDSSRAAYLEGVISVVVNSLLFVLKLWAGAVSGSLALTADAWHTLSDSFSSVFVIIGAKLSSIKPDKKHPFGHGRWEQIVSIFIGFLLGIIAYDFLRESIIRFQSGESANFGVIAIVVTIVSIVVKEGLAQYAFILGRKTGNVSIKADGWHHRSDALSSVVVLFGIFLKDYFWWIDSALGFVISIMLFYAVFVIFKESINKILGETPSEELIENIKQIVNELDAQHVLPHHFHIHNYVTHKELTFHIKVDSTFSIKEGHEVATRIEDAIRDKLNIEATIHVEPLEKVC